jgi:hypothetical protein
MTHEANETPGAAAGRTRRDFLVTGGGGLVALGLASACARAARDRGESFRVLGEADARALEALGDTLLPGAAAAGIAHYVDHQLAGPTPLLMLRYVDYPAPFARFYAEGLAALDGVARARHARAFAALGAADRETLVREVAGQNPPGWSGPPAPLFYFVTRNDAMDVVYGTPEGFATLGIPYMPHIAPTERW